MAKIKDIVEVEAQRGTMEQCRVINIFAEGTFYHAYEWSAWLCVRYIQEFKVTKRLFKKDNVTLVFVGFPLTSLQKNIPEGAVVKRNDDTSVQIILPEAFLRPEDTLEGMLLEFKNWKQSMPFTENSKKEMEEEKYAGVAGAGKPARITDIVHKILAYPTR